MTKRKLSGEDSKDIDTVEQHEKKVKLSTFVTDKDIDSSEHKAQPNPGTLEGQLFTIKGDLLCTIGLPQYGDTAQQAITINEVEYQAEVQGNVLRLTLENCVRNFLEAHKAAVDPEFQEWKQRKKQLLSCELNLKTLSEQMELEEIDDMADPRFDEWKRLMVLSAKHKKRIKELENEKGDRGDPVPIHYSEKFVRNSHVLDPLQVKKISWFESPVYWVPDPSLLKTDAPPKTSEITFPRTETIQSGLSSFRFFDVVSACASDGIGLSEWAKAHINEVTPACWRKIYNFFKLDTSSAAAYALGWLYLLGKGVAKDEVKAIGYCKKNSLEGHAWGQNNLGYCYEHGRGVEQDYKKAIYWYRKAADQGNASAQCNLGYCYFNGHGVEKDVNEFVRWCRLSADQGYGLAQYHLAACYEHGNGVEQNFEIAKEYYRKSAEQGNENARRRLFIIDSKY